ncbi:MAG TPA: SO2930 family diheme c-type cytochrome, partial [Puia sp.]|nr:SO2930 family diheme c-type cytochrome [Puia sp.]
IHGCKNKTTKDQGNITVNSGFVFRQHLSDYGFFKGDLKELNPVNGVVRYELVTPLFTDYAKKDRFIVVPANKQIRYSENGVLDFPDSTILIKNFAYLNAQHQKIMIETRLLVKDPAEKTWKVMDYLWDSTQTDAVQHIAGAKIPVQLMDDGDQKISTVYQVPNTNDCKRCHMNSSTISPIGPKARNLNFVLAGHSENQLTEWENLGILSGLPELSQVPKLPDWKDSVHYSVNERARAYLDVNCAHCHTQGGDAMNTGLFLEYQQEDPFHLGAMKSPVSAGGGAGGMNYDIIPGDAANSILAYRMNSTEPGTAMPELARTIVHKEAVSLIVKWINGTKSDNHHQQKLKG